MNLPLHGARRFHNPVEGRYYSYSRPALMISNCGRCGNRLPFRADPIPTERYDEAIGGYEVLRGEICGVVTGRGACTNCGRIVCSIKWPEEAYFQVRVPEGVVWAWNEEYLPALQARVSGDKVALRHLTMGNWSLTRYISRLPKFAVLTKNRSRILSGLTALVVVRGASQ